MLNLRKLRRSVRRFFSWFSVYAEFRMKRLWFFLRYGGLKNVPMEVLRMDFEKEFEFMSKGLAEMNKRLPERIESVWNSGHEEREELVKYLLRDSADIDESFNKMKQDAEILLRVSSKKSK